MTYLAPHWDASALIINDMRADLAEGGATAIPGPATDAVSQATPERLADLAGIGVTLLTTAEITAELPSR